MKPKLILKRLYIKQICLHIIHLKNFIISSSLLGYEAFPPICFRKKGVSSVIIFMHGYIQQIFTSNLRCIERNLFLRQWGILLFHFNTSVYLICATHKKNVDKNASALKHKMPQIHNIVYSEMV